MAYLEFEGVGIAGLGAAVPRQIIDNLKYTTHFSAQDAADIVAKTGIRQRRFAAAATCASVSAISGKWCGQVPQVPEWTGRCALDHS